MLDVVYTLITDDLRERLIADRQIIGFAQVMGADMEMPNVDLELEKFNEFLDAEPLPQGADSQQLILMRALGLRD